MTRRILVNYRVDPCVVEALLPQPFRTHLFHGACLCGICLVRLEDLRPRGIPGSFGLSSENAALRFHVEWNEGDNATTGVFVPGRLTNSRFVAAVGGRLFPGVHQYARFEVMDEGDSIQFSLRNTGGTLNLEIGADVTGEPPSTSVFDSLEDASDFFKSATRGCSPNRDRFDHLELAPENWNLRPLAIRHLEAAYFDDTRRFPVGTIEFDSAFLMRDIQHEWRT